MLCDLHTHSLFSDGTYTPTELIRAAKEIGLSAIALTDHNTVSGLDEFFRAAQEASVTAVGGVELSCEHRETEFHLLGLFLEPEHFPKVERLSKEMHVQKEISNIETIERLNEAGYLIRYADVRKKNPTGNVNRAHIAAELLQKGYVDSISHAFQTILSDGAGFYVPPTRLQLTEAIGFLKELGAVSVLAHPLKDTDEGFLRALLPEAVAAGLCGIEVQHPTYDEKKRELSLALAEEFSLLKSGGSDFHGQTKPDTLLGTGRGNVAVPTRYYEELLRKKTAQRA